MPAPKPLPRKEYPSRTDPEARAAYAAGLRHLADVIESDPDCPYPQGPLSLFLHQDNQAEIAARLRRSLGGGKWQKTEHGGYLTLDGMCAGLPIDLWLDRAEVCERVVVGTETVVIPAVEAQPEREVERPVIEWRCAPVLEAAEVQA
jgi:hypothetical protein